MDEFLHLLHMMVRCYVWSLQDGDWMQRFDGVNNMLVLFGMSQHNAWQVMHWLIYNAPF